MDYNNFESKSAQEILQWTKNEYGQKAGLASSFGMEDMVLIAGQTTGRHYHIHIGYGAPARRNLRGHGACAIQVRSYHQGLLPG